MEINVVFGKKNFIVQHYFINDFFLQIRHSQIPSLPDLNVTGAWEMGYTGRGRVVTFLDDGLEFDHPDLQENYVCLFKDFIFEK